MAQDTAVLQLTEDIAKMHFEHLGEVAEMLAVVDKHLRKK